MANICYDYEQFQQIHSGFHSFSLESDDRKRVDITYFEKAF